MYFILSPGADVVADVDALAAKNGLEKGSRILMLVWGKARMSLLWIAYNGHKQGHWVILNNIHLIPRWCIELEKTLGIFIEEGSHERFRSIFDIDPSNNIPIGILSRVSNLQMSLQLV